MTPEEPYAMSSQWKVVRRARHDGFFKSVFADTRVVAAEVQAVLPRRLWRQLDLRHVEVVGARFAEATLATPESDAVFQVSTAAGDARVFVMLEHQRDAPKLMPFRVLRYVTAFWSAHLKAHPSARTLPPVVPLVVANVPGGWTGPRGLDELLDGPRELVDAVRPYLPALELVVDDLSLLDAKAVMERPGPPLARLAWWLMSLSTDLSRVAAEAEVMRPLVQAVREEAPEHHRQAMVYLRSLPMTTSQRRKMNDAFEIISMKEYRKRVPFLQDIIREELIAEARARGEKAGLKKGTAKGLSQGRVLGRQQGRSIGRAEGRVEGLAEGRVEGVAEGLRTALLVQWPLRFGTAPGPRVQAQLQRATLATLKRWTKRLLTARRPADVFS
ncbi:MAG: Rpn family recombination-promoting nuclease/putative transposase [Myxococcaceae bacterium]|nr:Rpn family recombination-promoting nuclease/putative transposase [Myxococcaceae bacterium]